MQKLTLILILIVLLAAILIFVIRIPSGSKNCKGNHAGDIPLENDKSFSYLLFQPRNPSPSTPLLIILHGRGERGSDNRKPAEKIGCDILEGISKKYGSWIFLPQCPTDRYWIANPNRNFKNFDLNDFKDPEILDSLESYIRNFNRKHPVDTNRIYIIGHSMGGMAVWRLLFNNPKLFAGAIPVSTSCDPGSAPRFSDTGVWLVMGEEDPYFSKEQILEMYYSLKDSGHKNAYVSFLEDQGHDIFPQVLSNNTFMDWLFSQRK